MNIAQVAPLYESVPPKFYGGTERVVSYLTEELVNQGHKVTLFASGDSVTSAELVSCSNTALRLDKNCLDPLAPHIVQMERVLKRAHEFDIIHFHTDYLHFPSTERLRTPHVTTLHGRLDIPELQQVYDNFKQPVVSISDSQRKPVPQANFVATVHHGLPQQLLKQGTGSGNYLAFLGRISPEKGLDRAIEWAIAANMPLKIAAKVDKVDELYYETVIKPLMQHPLVEYIGEINEYQKQDFLGNAAALLFAINWSEPFGLVMIEAMACGTPVVAHAMGSVPEIIENGRNGFIVSSTEEAVAVIHTLKNMKRSLVRAAFDERFTANRMACNYMQLYKKLIASGKATNHWPIIPLQQQIQDQIAKTKLL